MSTFNRLTLIGLYNHVPSLFDRLTLPAAYDKKTFIDTLLLDQGEKCVAYPEPDFFTYAVGVWSRKWAKSLERVAMALNDNYNPLHNFDRHEEWSESEEGAYTNHMGRGGEDTENRDVLSTTDLTGSTETVTGGHTTKTVTGSTETTKQGVVTTRNTGTTDTMKTGSVTTALTGSTDTTKTGSVTTTNGGTVTTAETGQSTETTNNMTTERTVSAYNESGYQPAEKTTVNGSVTRQPNTLQTVTPNTTETVTPNTTETVTPNTLETVTPDTRERVIPDVTETVTPNTTETVTPNTTERTSPATTETVTPDTHEAVETGEIKTLHHGMTEDGHGGDNREKTHTAHLFGNIGVTTSQKMAMDEVDLRVSYNMYSVAATLFADDLLLMLY